MKHKPKSKRKNRYQFHLATALHNAAAYVPLIMLPFGLLVKYGVLDDSYYSNDTAFISILSIYTLTSILYLCILKKLRPKKTPRLPFIVMFHTLTLLFILFVSGFLNAFLAIWIVLMISSYLLYGSKGFYLSFLGLALTGAIDLALQPGMPTHERFEIVQATIVAGTIGYVIVRIRAISEKERDALFKTRRQENFQRERLLALVNSMGDAVVTTDEEGIIKVYNAALLNLLDTNANLSRKNIDSVLGLQDLKNKKISLIQEAHKTRKIFSRTDLVYKFNDDAGTMRLYINIAPISPDYQSHAEKGFIFIIRDITKEKTLEEERDEFISVVSHELRTPIAIAEGNLSNIKLLQKNNAAPDLINHALTDAHDQILYLAKMINDLSTLSRAERGMDKEEAEVIDIKKLLHELYQDYLPKSQKQKLHLNLDVKGKIPKVKTSRLYIEEILQNLVTNAMKYTQKGSVTITGKNTKEGVYIGIKDTGIGISKSDQRHIFEKFYRSEDYRTRESSGTGLGLYVSKKLADKINVEIDFESRLNHGSTFSITLKPFDDDSSSSR